MSISKSLTLVALAGVVFAGAACTQKAADDAKKDSDVALAATREGIDNSIDATREGTATVIEETREAGEKTADATKNIAQQTGDKAKEIAGKTADKTKEIAAAVGSKTKAAVSTTGETITDGWITTKVSAKFVDESLLKESHIDVDTSNHVVTLKGTVRSQAAKTRAAAIARGTEGVTRVVDQLVVK